MNEKKTIGMIGDREIWRKNYYAALEACGAKTFPLIAEEDLDNIKDLDGIVIPGGVDINPAIYGKENEGSVDIDDALDAFEWKVLEKAVALKKPILGICRGLQFVNVYFGGTLIQDMEHKNFHTKMGTKDRSHAVHTEQGTFLYEAHHKTNIMVTSAHHQAIDVLGKGLLAVAASDDQILEAIEHESLPIICVQWHPERMCLEHARPDTDDGLPLFDYFIHTLCETA